MTPPRDRRVLVAFAAALLAICFATALAGDLTVGLGLTAAVQSFQIPNLMLSVPAGACGLVLAWNRPANRLGWLLLGAGAAGLVSSACVPPVAAGMEHQWPLGVVRTLSMGYSAWTACQFLFLPLAIVFFPTGELPSRRWRSAVPFILATFLVQLVRFSTGDSGLEVLPGVAAAHAWSWLAVPGLGSSTPFAVGAGVVELLDYVLVFSSIGVRFRAGDERVRRQVLWLLWALAVAVALIVVDLTAIHPGATVAILSLGLMGLVPVAMTIAVLRYQVLDIRLVWSRTLAWSILTAGVVGVYVAIVTGADHLLQGRIPSAAPAALVIAIGFHPARTRLQDAVDQLLYGDRRDPVRAAAAVAAQMESRVTTPADLLEPIRAALKLPFAELRDRDTVVATSGVAMTVTESVPLLHGGAPMGELIVGVRAGQRRLHGSDRAVLGLVAAPLALALHATALRAAVQQASDELAEARASERERLRHDLHDGLGPLLTGIALHADAAANLLPGAPDKAAPLVAGIRSTVDDTLREVRTLIDRLRPASVEELGLTAAIEHFAGTMTRRPDGSAVAVIVEATEMPHLSIAAEIALYRIATESVNNALRHSEAERVDVELSVDDDAVVLTIHDDGGGSRPWTPGVGLSSMRDRARLLGGSFQAGPGRIGGKVEARIPIEVEA